MSLHEIEQPLTQYMQNITQERSITVPKYKPYSLRNYHLIPQIERLTEDQRFAIEVVGRVLPFRSNNYVVDELINWDDIPNDPMFVLTFPQKDMLQPKHFNKIADLLKRGATREEIDVAAHEIRMELSPHPAGQLKENRPQLSGEILKGMQHKYAQTALFFPQQGQTCHAYCTFCFRWAQFIGKDDLQFAMKEIGPVIQYIRENPGITDILITGGDPLTMRTKLLSAYIEPLLDANIPHLKTIRIGSKALSYWPYRFLTDNDAGELLYLFNKVVRSGKHLTLMAHFNHPREMSTAAVRQAILQIRETGAQIRTQSPLLAHINNDPDIWAEMWQQQVDLGCVPYYMFIARDTGAQHFFSVPLVDAWKVFQQAYQQVSGIGRTVRGPVMSCSPGKIQMLGVAEVAGEKTMVLRAIQNRDPDAVLRPFFAEYDEKATWYTDLKPAFGNETFL
jgi:KamA family protein